MLFQGESGLYLPEWAKSSGCFPTLCIVSRSALKDLTSLLGSPMDIVWSGLVLIGGCGCGFEVGQPPCKGLLLTGVQVMVVCGGIRHCTHPGEQMKRDG
jgi:hypothetical protein